MKSYQNKQELEDEILKTWSLYDVEFEDISEEEQHLKLEGADKSPSENLAYQIGWTNLLLQWEQDEKDGTFIKTPTADYKWNNLGGLYQSFYQTHAALSLKEKRVLLHQNVQSILLWLESISHMELFEPNQRLWTKTSTHWPIWKWVHINTCAPFKNFRSQLREWKKLKVKDKL